MLRLLAKLVLAGAVLAALWLWVPVGGRTLAARWDRAGSFPVFVERGWDELAGHFGSKPPADRRPTARSQARVAQGPSRTRPSEAHTEADRRALDRVLQDELRAHP
ncbi:MULTISPECIES: hypothetical protein [Anaeromyxobacter]|uniref:hypothetical protein n=1 Tax=Anaeromyxobacter TaxID=161492 RepID=UPI001F5A2ACF|nr:MULTISPECIES: hypothetical protein [unclassified Anaeromyxobacter]